MPGPDALSCAIVPTFLTGSAEPDSARSGLQAPRPARPRGNLPTAAAVAAVLIQLALAQLTLVLAVVFVIVGRVSRWRRSWLAWPAAAGVLLTAALGIQRTVAGYLVAARHLMLFATGQDPALVRLPQLSAAVAGWRHWPPAQLPVALIVAAAEASIVARLGKRAGPRRAGALVAARRAYVTFSLRRGEVATGDGGAVGIISQTGRRAEISWREAQAGVLITGVDAAAVTSTGLELATAAIQHRKTVIIIDLAGRPGYGAFGGPGTWCGRRVRPGQVAARLRGNRPDVARADPAFAVGAASGLAGPVEAACAGWQAPLLGLGNDGYDPLSRLAPSRATGLVMAMIDWSASTAAGRSFCAGYVRTALAVLATTGPAAGGAVGRGGAGPPTAVFADLAGLLRPGALSGRLAQADRAIRDRDGLASRARELTSWLDADPSAAAAVAAAATQLAALAAAVGGSVLGRPEHGAGAQISLARALAERQVVLIGADPRLRSDQRVMLARLAVADLTDKLAQRAEIGAPADCLAWINGCEAIGEEQLSGLLAVGPATGTAVVLGTTAGAAAASLVGQVNVLAVRGRAPSGLDGRRPAPPGRAGAGEDPSRQNTALPARHPAQERHDTLSLRVRGPRRRAGGCRVVR